MHDQPANNTMTQDHEAQLTSTVMMIRPAGFESNPLTAASNRFQGKSTSSPAEQQATDCASSMSWLPHYALPIST